MGSGTIRRCTCQHSSYDAANGWLITNAAVSLTGAAMNAILFFPPNLAVELRQMKVEVESHGQDIAAEAAAFEHVRAAWAVRESDLDRRMNALHQRLANVLA